VCKEQLLNTTAETKKNKQNLYDAHPIIISLYILTSNFLQRFSVTSIQVKLNVFTKLTLN